MTLEDVIQQLRAMKSSDDDPHRYTVNDDVMSTFLSWLGALDPEAALRGVVQLAHTSYADLRWQLMEVNKAAFKFDTFRDAMERIHAWRRDHPEEAKKIVTAGGMRV